jgi:hypothetical protein
MANVNGRAAGNVGEVVVPLPADRELSSHTAEILASHPPINVLRMFGLTEDMLPAVLAMVGAVFKAEGIAPRLARSWSCGAHISSTFPTSGRQTS